MNVWSRPSVLTWQQSNTRTIISAMYTRIRLVINPDYLDMPYPAGIPKQDHLSVRLASSMSGNCYLLLTSAERGSWNKKRTRTPRPAHIEHIKTHKHCCTSPNSTVSSLFIRLINPNRQTGCMIRQISHWENERGCRLTPICRLWKFEKPVRKMDLHLLG